MSLQLKFYLFLWTTCVKLTYPVCGVYQNQNPANTVICGWFWSILCNLIWVLVVKISSRSEIMSFAAADWTRVAQDWSGLDTKILFNVLNLTDIGRESHMMLCTAELAWSSRGRGTGRCSGRTVNTEDNLQAMHSKKKWLKLFHGMNVLFRILELSVQGS